MDWITHGKMEFPRYPENDGTIICFTGADVPAHRDTLIRMGADACKISYYGLTQRQINMNELIEDLSEFEYVVMEPGMGSLRNIIRKYGGKFDIPMFIEKYYDFCEQVSDLVNVFFTFDLATDDFDWEDIERHAYMGYDRGLHIAPTVFPFTPQKALEESGYLDTFDMVIMPFPEKHWNRAQELAESIYDKGLKIHGHSVAPHRLQYLPLYSCDTSAWLDGQKYGSTYRYANGRLAVYNVRDKEKVRPGLYGLAEEWGLDVELLRADTIEMKDDYKYENDDVVNEVNALNLVSWIQFANHKRNFQGAHYVRGE